MVDRPRDDIDVLDVPKVGDDLVDERICNLGWLPKIGLREDVSETYRSG